MNFRKASVCVFLNVLICANANALSFGVFDPRSLAMGGTGVSAGNSANAAFYNPALLALYNVRKEAGQNSRFVFPPSITARVPNAIGEYADASQQAFDQDIVNAINAFNNAAQPNAADAQAVVDASQTLENNLSSFSDGPLDAEAHSAIVFSVAHLKQGGSMYFSSRAVTGSDISGVNADKQLLSNYIEAMRYIASNQTEGSLHPELFDNNGNLLDQTGSLSSAISGRGVIINEMGISMSGQFSLFGSRYALGFTPKFLRVTTYDIVVNGINNNSNSSRRDDEAWKPNIDFGIVKEYRQNWWSGEIRSGLVVKNIFPHEYLTALGNIVRFEPQIRAATSFHRGRTIYAIDIDVLENNSIGRGSKSQILALGGEWGYALGHSLLKLRAGLNYNLKAVGKYKTPLYSLGLHINSGVIFDLTYAQNSEEKALGMLFAFRF